MASGAGWRVKPGLLKFLRLRVRGERREPCNARATGQRERALAISYSRSVLWIALAGIAVLVVTVLVSDPLFRLMLSLVAVLAMIYIAIRVALGSERRLTREQRKYLKLRMATDEFLMNVRNRNRLLVAAGQSETQPTVDLDAEVDEVVSRMHKLVDQTREAAGKADRPPGFVPGALPEIDQS